MKKAEKSKFVQTIVNTVSQEILEKIENNKIPKDWEEVELLRYISDCFKKQVNYMSPTQQNQYRRAILDRNL